MALVDFAGGVQDALRQMVLDRIEKQKVEHARKMAEENLALNQAQEERARGAAEFEKEQWQSGASERETVQRGRLLTNQKLEQDIHLGPEIERQKEERGYAHEKELERLRQTGRQGRQALTPGQEFQMTTRLQRDYDRVVQPTREMARQLRIMEIGLAQAKAGNMNAGSQQILVTFQKILDPTSVVRESEYARSPQGQAYLKRIEGFLQRVTQGGPGVTMEELENFVEAGRAMTTGMAEHGASKRKQLEKTAGAFGLDTSLLFDEEEQKPTDAGGSTNKTADELISQYGGG